MRKCSKCSKDLSEDMFYAGSTTWCKPCLKQYNAERYRNKKSSTPSASGTKICSTCKSDLPVSYFKRQLINSDGLMGECMECYRNRILVRKFGITSAIYDTMLKEQNGVCAICEKPCNTGRMLAVDHCHKTGKVRGLLCSKCNRALGLLEENKNIISSMIGYIDKHES